MELPVLAQETDISTYSDDWIVDGQQYYMLEVDDHGIYRISREVMIERGIEVDQISASAYQLYTLGEEVAVSIGYRADSTLAYLEFYGRPNDGTLDAQMYEDPGQHQLNPFISLYSDQRPYYLTWSSTETGRRIRNIDNGMDARVLPPQEPYYIHREVITYDDFHQKPTHDGRNFIRYSSMDAGEGYGSRPERSRTIDFPIKNLSPIGIDPRVVMRVGTNVNSLNWTISSDQRNLKTASQRGYGTFDIDERFPLEDLSEGDFAINIAPLGAEDARHIVAQAELHYPRTYSFEGETQIQFHQQASILSRYIEIAGFGGQTPLLYNLSTGSVMTPRLEGNLIQFVTVSANEEQEWLLVDEELSIKKVMSLDRIDMPGPIAGAEYLILSHASFIEDGVTSVYADYRSSEEGGDYDTRVVDIADLTHRYAYGVKGHPVAIRNAMRYLRDQVQSPDFIFLIGKGLEYTALKNTTSQEATVPTWGIPGSDNLLVAFDGQRHPQIPIGRLAARRPEEVLNYLDKIKAHELRPEEDQTISDQLWKKNIIHLSGGSASNQAILFRFLNDMGAVIESKRFGADVLTFRKTSADPLERATTDQIMKQIDEGSALITFFGHSAVGTFDFSLEDPSRYNNQGRNPIILSLGCHSGNIHTNVSGISEDFVLEKDRGAIAFIASSGTAYPEPQYVTGINFYDLIGEDLYGQPIGEILQKSLEARTNQSSLSVQTLVEQLTLHGDPAYKFGAFEGPDYIVDAGSVSITPALLDATTLSYTVTFDVLNLGILQDEVLDISLIHQLPDGTRLDPIEVSIPAPGYRSTITVDLNHPGTGWVGANRILISVDPDKEISEAPTTKAENNNDLIFSDGADGFPFFVFDNSAKPVSPPDFGIYHDQKILVRASVNNGLDPGGLFEIQMDTTTFFDSPIFQNVIIDNQSSIIDWYPDIEHIPGVVYYWRIAPVSEDTREKSDAWQNASFIYLPDHRSGWNQSHYFQQLESEYNRISLDDERDYRFDDRIWDIRIKNEIRDEGDFWVFINNTPWASLNPRGLGNLLSIFIWDRQNVIFKNSGSDYGSIPFTSDGFLFDMDSAEDLTNIIALLNEVPDGARIFFHTMLEDEMADLNVGTWDDAIAGGLSLVDILEEQGASRVDELVERGTTVPYTLVFDKNEGLVVEDLAQNLLETIDLTSKTRTLWGYGEIKSPIIDVNGRLLRLNWSEQKTEEDHTRLVILGIKAPGAIDTVRIIEDDYDVNLTGIRPESYSQIQLVYQVEDEVQKTMSALDYWRVTMSDLPDIAFHSTQGTFDIIDTLDAGQPL